MKLRLRPDYVCFTNPSVLHIGMCDDEYRYHYTALIVFFNRLFIEDTGLSLIFNYTLSVIFQFLPFVKKGMKR